MRITVSYCERDVFDIPDKQWHKAMSLSNNDVDNAFDLLMEESIGWLHTADITDRHVEVEEEG
jgi:hypothetical protein